MAKEPVSPSPAEDVGQGKPSPPRAPALALRTRKLLISAIAFLLAFYVLSRRWEPPREEVRTARLTTSDPQGTQELVATGWVQSNEVRRGGRVHFWIAFHNRSEVPIRGLRLLDLRIPGFDREGDCWQGSRLPVCVAGQVAGLPPVLGPGQSATLYADLRARAVSGSYSPFAVFVWRNPKGGWLRKGLSLGPVKIKSGIGEVVAAGTVRLYTVIKDLALPLAVALLTYLFQKRTDEQKEEAEKQRVAQQRREDEQRAQQQRREEEAQERDRRARTDAEQLQAQVFQTWSQLLHQHLHDAQCYYLPLNSKLVYLRRRARTVKPGDPEELRECFYWLMAFLRQAKHTAESIGGVHFKNRTAEAVFGLAWAALRDRVEQRFGAVSRDRALAAMEVGESRADLQAKLEKPEGDPVRQLFADLEDDFKAWLEDREDPFSLYLPLADLMSEVLDFEMNRPFEHWYGEPPFFRMPALELAERTLPEQPEKIVDELREKLADYLEQARYGWRLGRGA